MEKKEPENPIIYLSNQIKKLDVKNRNGITALIFINIIVVLIFKIMLTNFGLLK